MQTVDPAKVDPSVLAAALQAIRPKLTSAQLAQLEGHYTAQRRVIANDDKGHLSPIIMYYGKIGGALSRHLQLRPAKYQFRWLMMDRPIKDGTDFEWHLHPNVVKAIASLKWFADSPEPLPSIDDIEGALQAAIAKSRGDSRELRLQRLLTAPRLPQRISVQTTAYVRNEDVVVEVLSRAAGNCESCESPAPFIRQRDETPYLEVHHTIPLAEGGEDTVENGIALCPNCHRARHHAKRQYGYGTSLSLQISNEELSLELVPSINASFEEIGAFALTFDGYEYWGSFERCSEVAGRTRHETLADLRTCLFFRQRAWRHADGEPNASTDKEWRQLLTSIRAAVQKRRDSASGQVGEPKDRNPLLRRIRRSGQDST